MGIPVLILGESGAGKSASLRNFEPGEIGIFNVASKPLPFRKKLPSVNGATYPKIWSKLPHKDNEGKYPDKYLKSFAVDDAQYLMAFESFDRVNETGYGKFTAMALNFYNLVQSVIRQTPPDVIVYFLQHTEKSDDGRVKAKTLGKMLDNQLTLEGLFSIVLLCKTDGNRHYFETQSDGSTTAKSPMDMFDREIDNDLKMVDTTIREYWGLIPEHNKEENKE